MQQVASSPARREARIGQRITTHLGDDASDEADHFADEVHEDQGHHEDEVFGGHCLEADHVVYDDGEHNGDGALERH